MRINHFFLILLMVFTSCENRDWDNPFDPDCPKELFTPANFTAKQEENVVKLTWTQTNTQISGFTIERSVDGGTWSSVATPAKTNLTWSDSNITGGKLHAYRLVATAGTNKSNEVTAQVTPVFSSSVTTSPLTKLLSTSAILGGEIASDGGAPVTARGVCWNTTPNPTIANSKTSDGTGAGTFTSTITGLNTNTNYYVRAYATTSVGTSYGNEISFETYFGEVTDIDGNVYPTVKIGEQIWMAENLKVTKYNDGTSISNVTDNTIWAGLTTGAYCWYNNDATTYKNVYGALYNWYAVNTGKLAPEGWHVPTDAEWTTLTTYLGEESVAGNKMKTTSGWANNGNGTNSSGFSGLPGGYRNHDGSFYSITLSGNWWSSTESGTNYAWYRTLDYSNSDVSRDNYSKDYGFSIRCVLGNLNPPSVSTAAISNKTASFASSGGNIASDGGSAITERGVCWSTSSNPTTANSKTTDGNGTGSFTSSITGLTENTTYYVRAYAINSQGTGYGNEVSFTTYQSTAQTVTDIEGNVYNTVTIGTQVWMVENLKTTKYNDGTEIPNVILGDEWTNLNTSAYCWQKNDINNKGDYGALYNWFTISTDKLCPTGWHVPDNSEWEDLATFLGGASIAGGKMKEPGLTHWVSPNTGATNSSGFTAIPGGWRAQNGTFQYLGRSFTYYASNEMDAANAYAGYILSEENSIVLTYSDKKRGRSVRCILGENPEPNVTVPSVSTTSTSSVTSSSVHLEASVISDGNSTVTERGFCWGSWTNIPTIEQDSVTRVGEGVGSFNADLVWLESNTTYYGRAYAINSEGISYGEILSFKTLKNLTIPSVFTITPKEITSNSALLGGQIVHNGDTTVTERGVVYGLSQNPTTSDNKIVIGSGDGLFSTTVSGLSSNTKYYVRAYGTNSQGTGYGQQVSFTTDQSQNQTVTDIEGNVYNTVTIGTQVWMAENLKTTKYNDGAIIPNITGNSTWEGLTTGAYCWYNNDINNKATYGALYNWYTVNIGKLCPTGWHVPTDAEWTTLTTYLGGEIIAIGKMKTTSGWSSNGNGTNTSGFSALPGGFRGNNGLFDRVGFDGFWWSSTEASTYDAWYRRLGYYDGSVSRVSYFKVHGYSVRCVKD